MPALLSEIFICVLCFERIKKEAMKSRKGAGLWQSV